MIYRSLVDNSNLHTEQINLYKYERLLLLLYHDTECIGGSELKSKNCGAGGGGWVTL